MKSLFVAMLAVLITCMTLHAEVSTSQQLGLFGLGVAGGVVGSVFAITAIQEVTPQIESQFGKTAVVMGSLTFFDGLGAAAGVLVAGKIWDIDGSIPGSVAGGLVGGLASAFVEPLLYLIGIPEGWVEFLGMTMIPILPALGATWGFGL